MRNLTFFKGTPEKGFKKLSIYTNVYKKIKMVGGEKIEREIENLMLEFAYTPDGKEVDGKMVGNFKSDKIFSIRIGFNQRDINDIAEFLYWLEDKTNKFTTVHKSNVDNQNKSLVCGEFNGLKSLTISYEGKKISFVLTKAESYLIAQWIKKYFL